jgi:hypothetical protein
MLRRVRSQLNYANVMATVAVFLALGGGAYAAASAPRNSVTSTSIRNGQVKRQDLGRRAVSNSKLLGSAVSTGKIANNAVNNSKLAADSVSTTKVLDGAITTPKLADLSVTTGKLADLSVTTGKLADSSVTEPKLAPNSVNGLLNIEDGTVTGADVLENTLKFGCTTPTVQSPNSGPFQIGSDGFCAFVMHPASGRTWTQAATDCNGVVGDSTLANPVQIAQLQATNGGSTGPVTGTTGIWTAEPAATTSVWTVHVGNGGTVDDFTATPIGNMSSGPEVCVYQPASKNG